MQEQQKNLFLSNIQHWPEGKQFQVAISVDFFFEKNNEMINIGDNNNNR